MHVEQVRLQRPASAPGGQVGGGSLLSCKKMHKMLKLKLRVDNLWGAVDQ